MAGDMGGMTIRGGRPPSPAEGGRIKDSILRPATREDLERLLGAVRREVQNTTLDNWRIVTVSLPKKPERWWTFAVADTPPELLQCIEWPNLQEVMVSSNIVVLDLDHGLIETRSRSGYRLGRRAEGPMSLDVQQEVLHRFWSHR